MVSKYVPERGDVVWLSFDPTLGREQAKRRPALVLSPKNYNNKSGLVLACAVTSKVKGYPFEILISSQKLKGAVLVDQIRSLDWHKRKIKFIEKCDTKVVREVQENLSLLLLEE